MVWLVGIWVAANWWWLWVNRSSRVFELDEAGYASMAARMSRQGTPKGLWVLFNEGVHGPLQAIMATPPQWVLGSDPATLLWQNVVFGAGTAVAVYAMTKQLASRNAGVVAAAITLLSPGIIEHSRLALTVMPSVFFASLALAALVHGRGLERTWWAVAAGAAIGCMTLSRSMTIGFVPVIGVAALGWAISRRTPWRVVLRNGALAAVAGLVVALWWWVLRWPDVSDYLFGGGSADTVQNNDLVEKARLHTLDLRRFVGQVAITTGVVVYVVLRLLGRLPAVRRRVESDTAHGSDDPQDSRAPEVAASDHPLALWPLVASAASGIVVLSIGTAFGVGFTLPLLPAVVTAGVAAVWRTLPRRLWWIWAPVVVLAAVVPSIVPHGSGLNSTLVWCAYNSPRSNCAVNTVAEGEAWSEAIADVGDRIWQARTAAADPWDFEVALLSRDMLLNGNSLGLDIELRRSVAANFYRFFQAPASKEDQLLDMVQEADLLVVTDDYRPDQTILGTFQPDPQTVLDTARAAGFTPCGEVALPDGRTVTFLAAPGAPPGTCAP
jgi:4-amino-4-deoxy-L-arabinose transferase-like glycosyltransferase